ncbi:hypothetical protein AB0I28_12395 [Phytomonospora sp. NPDC050363]|uniref:hypothetical protein n=1 Tax=Phytomonospora sp. NPDC050363 TaxID=3155642 RepID=UPI0033DE854A
MTYQDYIDQPQTLEAALEVIRRLSVERDQLRAANKEIDAEMRLMAVEAIGDIGQAIERDADLERARTVAVALEGELAFLEEALTDWALHAIEVLKLPHGDRDEHSTWADNSDGAWNVRLWSYAEALSAIQKTSIMRVITRLEAGGET